MPFAGSASSTPYTPHNDRRPLPKVDDFDNDKHSTMSHASGVSRVEHGYDALRQVAGNRVRRGYCAPEFLEEIASRGVQTSLKKHPERRFTVLSGMEARSYFKDYLRDHKQESDSSSANTIVEEPHVVFAVTVLGAGNGKGIDYYMTWRGKMNIHREKDVHHVSFLDRQFRKLAKGLDKEYKAISSLRNFGNISPGPQKLEKKAHRPSHKSRPPPPGITVSTPEDSSPKPDATQPTLPEPPASATDSVMSLPLLNMIRGVPFSHRVPLKVMNPDRLSMISESSISPEEAKGLGSTQATFSQNPGVPVITQPSKHDRSSNVHESSASIRSSDTRSTQSSRSSKSSSSSENRHDSRQPSPDGHKHQTSPDEIPEFLIVLLGDKFDNDTSSWHGLERQVSIRSLPADRHSPWIMPVVRSETISYRSSPTVTSNDSESEGSDDDEVRWSHSHSPVIPMKPLMEAFGIMPSLTHYHSPPVVPGGLQYQLSIANAASPARNPSPVLYDSPCLEPSNYVPAWLPPPQVANKAPSRPVSHVYSPAPYSSPYMQSHTGPF